MIEHHVLDDDKTLPVGLVNQSFQILFGSIGLIGCKIEVRIVSPTVVSFKFVERHQLDGVDAQALQVAKFFPDSLVGLFDSKITDQQFVN